MPRLAPARAYALALALALPLVAPLAAAAETLTDLEAVHAGTDQLWDVVVLQEESTKHRALVYRNAPTRSFGLVVYDAEGREVFAKNGTRGIQTLPPLEPGAYRFYVRGTGSFQVTGKAFERDNLTGVDTTLQGAADAYVLAPTKHYDVTFTGDVDVEWWDMTVASETFRAPDNRTAKVGGAYVITVTGAADAPYTVTLTPTQAPTQSETPAPGLALLLLLALGVALARRRS